MMPIKIKSELDRAAKNKSSFKVKSRQPPQGRIVFRKINGELNINITNSPVGFPPARLQEISEMVQVLQSEGKILESGSILISDIDAM